MKWAAEKISLFNNAEIEEVQKGGYILNNDEIAAGAEPILLNEEDLDIITDEIPGFEIATNGSLTIALDITLSHQLLMEGAAREFVNRVQNIRKDKDFELTDHIRVEILENDGIQNFIIEFKDYICGEILADSLEFVPHLSNGTSIEVNNNSLTINVTKNSKHGN